VILDRPWLTLLASLGLGACEVGRGPSVSSPAGSDGVEPSGLGLTPRPADAAPAPMTSRFAAAPEHFCGVTLRARSRPLLRTHSFLLAWNELAPAIPPGYAHGIPTAEIDARLALCGSSESCSIDAPRFVEAEAGSQIAVGVLIAGADGMLVAELGGEAKNMCWNPPVSNFEYSGPLVHVWAVREEQHYAYTYLHFDGDFPGYAYGHSYHRGFGYCTTSTFQRRDLLIDTETGVVELLVEQQAPARDGPWVELLIVERGVELRGCGEVLELSWT
jgi:hypothetical protein